MSSKREREKDVFRLDTSVGQRKKKSEGLGFDFSWGLRTFSLSHARDKTKKHLTLFLHRAQNLPSLFSIYKHDAIDIADPSSMQDACRMNFVIDLARRRVSVAQW